MKDSKTIKVIPIGGIEEIGKNMTLFEYNNQIIIIDCGLKFPTKNEYGIDFSTNDFDYIIRNKNKILGIFITHAHLDHIGGLKYLLQHINIPIYCSSFVKMILEEINQIKSNQTKYKTFKNDDLIKIGNFKIKIFLVNHSISDANGFEIEINNHSIIFTGDWRIDSDPIFEKTFNLNYFKDKKILALFCDSTNALAKTKNISERNVCNEIEDIIKSQKGRVIITTFSTQINRIKQIIKIAKISNRKILIIGRSMVTLINKCIERNLIKEINHFIKIKNIKNYKDNQILILVTGTQGEKNSGIYQLAFDQYKKIKLKQEDCIIFSSSVIPGNEISINQILNRLAKKQLKVITNKDRSVHVSGHASADEIFQLIKHVKPKYFIPIHGENIQLVKNKEIAIKAGIEEKNIFMLENGHKIEFLGNQCRTSPELKFKNYYLESGIYRTISDNIFKEREILRDNGFISILIITNKQIIEDIQCNSNGLLENSNELYQKIKKLINDFYFNKILSKKKEPEIKIKIKNFIHSNYKKNPIIHLNIV